MAKRYSSSVLFLRIISFFALRTDNLNVQEEVFAIAKISILIFALLRIRELSVQFLHWNCTIFTLLRKTVFCSEKLQMLWLFFGCILEQ